MVGEDVGNIPLLARLAYHPLECILDVKFAEHDIAVDWVTPRLGFSDFWEDGSDLVDCFGWCTLVC